MDIPGPCPESAVSSPSNPYVSMRVEGLVLTRQEVVLDEIHSRPCAGVPSVPDDLRRLKALGIFASVESRELADTLVYQVRELPAFLPVPNGRQSDEEGLSLGAGLKTPNLLGRAVAGEFLFLVGSSLEYQASVSASRLMSHPVGWEAMAGRTERRDDGRGYQELSHAGFLRLWGPTDRPLGVLAEIRLVDVRSDVEGICLEGRHDWIPSLRGGGILDTRDDPANTQRGIYQELTLEKTGRPMGGPVDAWQLLSDTRLWFPVGSRAGLHLANLMEHRQGTMDRWLTYVVGGANSSRGLPGAWAVSPSEDLATVEGRWTILPVRAFSLAGQNLYGGLVAVAGSDVATVWGEHPRSTEIGWFAGMDGIVPFVDRIRLQAAWSPATRGGWSVAFGLFEKTQAQRFRVR